jgi:hypothetical protein
MKKTTLISASLLLAFAGCTCGGGRPNIFNRLSDRIHGSSNVGEPCDAGCRHAAVAPTSAGCDNCGTSTVNYGGYDGQVIDSYEGVQLGAINTAPAAVYTSPTYPAATAPQAARMGTEIIHPKAAN